MPDPTSITEPDNWHGGFYELSLELGDRDDDRLQRALDVLWPAAGVVGCYHCPTDVEQVAAPLRVAALREFGHLRGVVRLPQGRSVVCGCFAFRYDDEPDWLTFYLPLGALGEAIEEVGGYPFDADSDPLAWRTPLDAWLADVADEVFRHVDFRLGLVGFEIGADRTAAELNGAVPDERWCGYLLPADGRLRYVPANR